ncbi:heat shock factor binding protein 1 domain-containing protein [Ditylenchus destructor]|nr:heat shock factor binding protein 1 domain-containing protein [Ditylenchus destructor]
MDGKSAEASGTKETEITANTLKTTGTSGVSLDGNREDEVSKLIESVLRQTQDRFQTMSDQIIRRIDEMAKRVDDLEKNISDLMTEAGVNVHDNN